MATTITLRYIMEQGLFSGVRVTRSLVFCVMVCRSLFVPLSFFFWSLCSLFFKIRLLITHLVSCDHCVLCPSSYGFWLPICYLVIIVFSVLRVTSSDYPFAILWPLCSLSFELRLLITHLVSCGHCVLCPSSYEFWLPICYLVTIVFSVLRVTSSDYPFAILWPLCSLSFALRLLITHLLSSRFSFLNTHYCLACLDYYSFLYL